MQNIETIAVRYGHQVEGLLERLGARGPARGAGDLLDQVKHLLDEPGLRRVRRFLRLRNKVIHNKPPEMPMPSKEQVEQAGQEAVAALKEVLARHQAQASPPPRKAAPVKGHRPPASAGTQEPPGPVYRIRERTGAYVIWVGPAGVWVVAEGREAREQARLDAEVRLVTRFPRMAVKALRRDDRLEARVRWGRPRLSPEEVREAVRLLTHTEPAARVAQPSGSPQGSEHRMRTVKLKDIPAAFYVGPVGVLVVADHPHIAEIEARRVWEDSQGALSVVPAVLVPTLKEPQGRVDGVLALRDEGAIREFLRGRRALDDDEVDRVAGWLGNRTAPVPPIRPKGGRYRLKGEEVAEGRTKAPPAFVVELVPPGPPPKPNPALTALRAVGWRVVFLPELVVLVLVALYRPGAESAGPLFLVGLVLLRFFALYGDPQGWKRWTLLGVGALELFFVWVALDGPRGKFDPGKLLSRWEWMIFLVPGLVSVLRGVWPSWPRWAALEAQRSRGRVR